MFLSELPGTVGVFRQISRQLDVLVEVNICVENDQIQSKIDQNRPKVMDFMLNMMDFILTRIVFVSQHVQRVAGNTSNLYQKC